MQSPSTVHPVPPRKNLREGQLRVVKEVVARKTGVLPVRLPTGYGKTLTAAASFCELWRSNEVTRLLYLVPTTAQLRQFTDDGHGDFLDAGLGGVAPFDIGYSPPLALKKHRKNEAVAFVATIQAVVSGAVGIAVNEMMQTGRWMVVVDEYHHYGVDKSWGRAVLAMNAHFTLAMSATPDRPGQDSAFGAPKVVITYREAVAEKAAKVMSLHSYEYRVDAITVNGDVHTFTTSQVAEAAGSADPNAIDKFIVDRKLRWSPKYISPLVQIPIERMLKQKRGVPLQMIVGAMGCLHAKMVCEQIKSMFGELLRIDWVGTGPNGRTDAENADVLKKFCPPKHDGARRGKDVQLDVLVHVGMAGEGLDSVFVTEIVHLNPATINNQKHQNNGRGSRRIPGLPDEFQLATINVDSSSPFVTRGFTGHAVMDAFDTPDDQDAPPQQPEGESDMRDLDDLPAEPTVMIADCELEHIDKGDPEVKACAVALGSVKGIPMSELLHELKDPDHELYERALLLRRRELVDRAKGQDGMSTLYQLRDSIKNAVGAVSSRAARLGAVGRPERSLIGDLMKRIYGEMSRRHGGKLDAADEQGLRKRYEWLKTVEAQLKTEGLPAWLR